MKKSIDFQLDDQENKFVECAMKIDEKALLEMIKASMIEASQKIICEYTVNHLNGSIILKKEKTSKILPAPSTPPTEIPFDEKEKKITYKYADKEWKRKALEKIIEDSRAGKRNTMDEIFEHIGVSPTQKKHFRRPLGMFLKKSGVTSKKEFVDKVNRIYYFI